MQSISPNYSWENGVKQIRLLKKTCHKSCILCQLLRTKTLASGSKCIKHFFLFLPLFALYLLSRCDLFHMSCLSKISLMARSDILCFNHFNLKDKIMKIEHKKIFWRKLLHGSLLFISIRMGFSGTMAKVYRVVLELQVQPQDSSCIHRNET